jgi:hypothetical protein
VRAFSGATGAELASFYAYAPAFTGGVFVAAGDVNGDGRAEIVTGIGTGGGPHVKVFSSFGGSELASFYAYDPAFTGGVRVGVGRVGGVAGVLTGPGPGGGPHLKLFDPATGQAALSTFAFEPAFTGGLYVG